jgi:hypothetical protein
MPEPIMPASGVAGSPYSSEGGGDRSSPDAIFDRAFADDKSGERPDADAAAAADTGDSGEMEAEPDWMADAPEEFKGIQSQANVSKEIKKWLKDTYSELQGFKSSAYGSPEAIQELSELFPGGPEDLRSASETLQSHLREQRMLESGDPEQMNEILEEKLVANPDSFIASLQGSLDALKRSNLTPEYNEIATTLTRDGLESVTDGHFAVFFDQLGELSQKYGSLAQSNPEEAGKIAATLANQALALADWWGGAKKKLGFGKDPAERGTSIRSGARPTAVVRPSETDQREMRLAQREVGQFNARLSDSHNKAIHPLISAAAKKELASHKIELSSEWMGDLVGAVDSQIKQNLVSDPQFQALLNRIHYAGNREDIRGYDLSDRAIKTLIDAAKLRATKLIPGAVRKVVAKLAQLNPQFKAPIPDANGGGGGARGPVGGPKGSVQEALKDRKLSISQTLDRILN